MAGLHGALVSHRPRDRLFPVAPPPVPAQWRHVATGFLLSTVGGPEGAKRCQEGDERDRRKAKLIRATPTSTVSDRIFKGPVSQSQL